MTRISFIALLAIGLAVVVQGSPSSQQGLLQGPIHTSQSWEYAICGSESDIVEIKSIKVSPDPPQPGQNLTVNVAAYVHEVVEEGAYADVTVKLGLIKLLHKQFDVCEEARNSDLGLECPVQVGAYNVSQTVALPKEIPPAKFVIEVKGYTVDDKELVCVNLMVDFMKHLASKKFGW